MATTDNTGRVKGRAHAADDPPTISGGVPSKCLSLTLSADWGHFRRIDRTVTKQTYRVPPRTTLAGLLAAIVGVGRDGYYDVFQPENSAIAIDIVSPVRTMAMPSLGLGTNPNETFDTAGGTGQRTVQAQFPDSTDARQLHGYHYLVEPSYRIDVAVEDPAFYGTLRHRLDIGTAYYTPTMGLSELLATVEYHGEFELDAPAETDSIDIDSVLPDGAASVQPTAGSSYAVEHVPAYMEADSGGRTTSGFVDYAFLEDAGRITSSGEGLDLATIDDRTVAFE